LLKEDVSLPVVGCSVYDRVYRVITRVQLIRRFTPDQHVHPPQLTRRPPPFRWNMLLFIIAGRHDVTWYGNATQSG